MPFTPFDDAPVAEGGFVPFDVDAPEPRSGFVRRFGGDTALAVAKSVAQLPSVAVGLADTVTGGAAGRGADHILDAMGSAADAVGLPAWARPNRWAEQLTALYTPETRAATEAVSTSAADAEAAAEEAGADKLGQVLAGAGGALKGIYENPSAALTLAAESYGGMKAIGMATARLLKPLAVELDAAVKAGTMTAEAAEAALSKQAIKYATAGEGVLTAGQVGSEISKETPEADWLHRLTAVGAGVTTAAIARGAARIPGLGDAEAAMATAQLGRKTGVAGGLLARTGKGALSEGVFQELPQSGTEQAWQNLGEGKPIQEGVGGQAIQGLAAGSVMGGGVAAVHGVAPSPKQKIVDAPDVDTAIENFRFELGDKADSEAVLAPYRADFKDTPPEEIAANQKLLEQAFQNDPTFAPDDSGAPTIYGAPLRAVAPQELPPHSDEVTGLSRDAFEAISALNAAQGLKTVLYADSDTLPDGAVNAATAPGVVFLSDRTSVDPAVVTSHEIEHLAQAGDKQAEFIRVVNEELTADATDLARARHDTKDAEGNVVPMSDAKLIEEIRADIRGDAAADPEFWGRVTDNMRLQLGEKEAEAHAKTFLESLTDLISRVRAVLQGTTFTTPGGKRLAEAYVKNLSRVHEALAAAVADRFIQEGRRPPGGQTNVAQVLVQRALDRQAMIAEQDKLPPHLRTKIKNAPVVAPEGSSAALVSALAAAQKAPFDRSAEERLNLEAVKAGVRMSPKQSEVSRMAAIRVRTPEFKKWFGGSKVPDVVYHGTGEDFETPKGRFWATSAPTTAETYAEFSLGAPTIIPAHMALKKPLVVDADGLDRNNITFRGSKHDTDSIADIAEREGYDGVIVKNVFDSFDGSGGLATSYVAFRPEQVKSVFNNRPTASPSMSMSPKAKERARIEASRTAQVNIGLDIGDGTTKVAPAAAEAALKLAGVKILKKTYLQSKSERTLVATLDRALTPTQANTISRSLSQEAIAQYSNGKGTSYGPQAAKWKFNPEYFFTHDGKTLAEVTAATQENQTKATLAGAKKDPRTGVALTKAMRAASLDEWLYGDRTPFQVRTQAELGELMREMSNSYVNPRTADTPENREFAARVIEHEVRLALTQEGHGLDWYGKTIDAAFRVAALIHPEIATNPDARFAFSYALAVTSNGATIAENTRNAFTVYDKYDVETGRMPVMGFGTRPQAMKIAFNRWNEMVEKLGSVRGAYDYMTTKHSVADLEKVAPNRHEKMGDTLYGGTIIGSKIGGGFLMNLNGFYDALATDRWFARTWGRILGNPLEGTPDLPGIWSGIPNAGEKHYARAVMATVLERVQKDRPDATIAGLQAVLWYPEKLFYSMHGVNTEAPTDYEQEVARYAEDQGIDPAEISEARRARPAGRVSTDSDSRRRDGEADAAQPAGTERAGSDGQGDVEAVRRSPKQEGSVDLVGVHFSTEPRTAISGFYYGRGMKGEEAKRVAAAGDSRLHLRAYAYLNQGEGVRPEKYVGGQAHAVKFTNLYDMDSDPLNLVQKDTNAFESAVLNAGFSGYFARGDRQGVAVMIGQWATRIAAESKGTAYRGEDLGLPPAVKYNEATQRAVEIATDKSLPDGQMTGADWRKVLGERAPAGLDDGKLYYKSDIGKVVREGVRLSPKSPEFKKWFGDSKVVDAEGKPLVVYHGTGADVAEFERQEEGRHVTSGLGFFFTEHPRAAELFAPGDSLNDGTFIADEGANIIPVYLAIENPVVMSWSTFDKEFIKAADADDWATADKVNDFVAAAVADGHDGILIRRKRGAERETEVGENTWVAFEPEQIKSVFNDKPTSDPDILKSPKQAALEKWAGNTKVRNPDGSLQVWYHGTARDISEFKPKQAGAIFLTRDTDFADGFSITSEEWKESREDEDGVGRNILPLYVKAENPFDYDDPAQVDALIALAEERNIPLDRSDIKDLRAGAWNVVEHPDTQKLIKMAGHDGFYVAEAGRKNLAVYDSRQLKSVTGNTGAYDGGNPDIRFSPKRVDKISKDFEAKVATFFRTKSDQPVELAPNTPASLQVFGWIDLPIVVEAKVLDKMKFDHGVTDAQFGKLPYLLQRPMFVFADNKNDSLVFVGTDLKPGTPALLAMKPERDSIDPTDKVTWSNMVVTGYSAPNGWDEVAKRLFRGELIYRDPSQAIPAAVEGMVKRAQKNKTPVPSGLPGSPVSATRGPTLEVLRGGHPQSSQHVQADQAGQTGTPAVVQSPTPPVDRKTRIRYPSDLVKWEAENWGEEVRFSPKNPEFKKWFGDSKVVDDNGEPLVVYHGTNRSFNSFDPEQSREGDGMLFVTPNKESASNFALYRTVWGGANVMPLYAKADKVLVIDGNRRPIREVESRTHLGGMRYGETVREFASRSRYDAIQFKNVTDDMGPRMPPVADVFALLPSAQIKSAIGNNGDYSLTDPDIRKSPKTTGASARTYTAAQERLFQKVGRTVEVAPIRNRIAAIRQDLGKKIIQGVVDQFAPLKELSPQAYLLARHSKDAPGALEALLRHGKVKLRDGVYDADQTGGFIDSVAAPLQGEMDDALWWIAAHRAELLTKEDREHLFDKQDIADGKTLADGNLDFDYMLENGQTTRNRKLAYQDTAAKYDRFNKNAMDMAEQSGMIDPLGRKQWEKMMYVPFYRVGEEAGTFVGGNVSAKLVGQSPFKRLKGGADKLNSDLMENVIQNWFHLLDSSSKNRAAKVALEAAANMGIAIEGPKPTVVSMAASIGNKGNTVWFLDGGVQRHFVVDDPYVMTAITSLEYAGMKGPIMKALQTFKHVLTVSVTASPVFKVRNLIRDSLQAVATAPLSYNVAGNVVAGFKASNHSSQTYVSALAGGGLIRFGTMLEGNSGARARQLAKMGIKESRILDSESKVQAVYDKFIEPAWMAYQELGNRSEEINRSALYKQMTDKGMNHATAAFMARDLMDFSLAGSWTAIRFLTQTVPFMNARMQGIYKLGRAAKEDPARFAAVLAATAAFSVALLAAYSDDDDWKKREGWDRDNYWWLKIGGIAFRIPKPFEVGAVATLAERGIELATDPEMTGERFNSRVLKLLSDQLSMNPIPQAVKPWLDVYANKDSFTGRPIESMGMERLQPDYRFTSRTSMAARAASTAGQAVTSQVGVDFLSPVQIDSILRGYFSWIGSFVVGMSETIARPLSGQPDAPAGNSPMERVFKLATGNFVTSLPVDQSRYVSHMYEQARVIEQAMGTYRGLIKQGKRDEAREFRDENRDQLVKYKSVGAVKRAISKLNERIRLVERSSKTPDEKREMITALNQQKDRIARKIK